MRGSIHKRGTTYSIVYRMADPKTGKTKQVFARPGALPGRRQPRTNSRRWFGPSTKASTSPPPSRPFRQIPRGGLASVSLDNQVAGGKLKPTTAAFYRNLTATVTSSLVLAAFLYER